MKQPLTVFSNIGALDNAHHHSMEQTDFTQLSLMVGKSLITDGKDGLRVDISRFREEIKLWRYYRRGNTACLFLVKEKPENKEGNGLISILPLILGNEKEYYQRQATFSFLYHTHQTFGTIFAGLLLGKFLKEKERKNITTEKKTLDLFKDELIHLSFNEFFKEEVKDVQLSFEKEKIKWIQIVDRIPGSSIKPLNDGVLSSEEIFIRGIDRLFQRWENSVPDPFEGTKGPLESKILGDFLYYHGNNKNPLKDLHNDEFLKEMDIYLEKLKKFLIMKSPLNFDQCQGEGWTDTNDLFNFHKGDRSKHCLLREFIVIENENNNMEARLVLKSKSGVLKLKKPLK